MHLLHDGLEVWVIVQMQHLPHVCPNSDGPTVSAQMTLMSGPGAKDKM